MIAKEGPKGDLRVCGARNRPELPYGVTYPMKGGDEGGKVANEKKQIGIGPI